MISLITAQADGDRALHELRITGELSHIATHSINLGTSCIGGRLLELTHRLGIVARGSDVVHMSRRPRDCELLERPACSSCSCTVPRIPCSGLTVCEAATLGITLSS